MIFSVQDGSFCYPGGDPVWKELSFSVQSGEILCVLGANGAGKTTLLRCMLGLLPWKSGQALLDGVPIGQLSEKSLWEAVSYVPQGQQRSGGLSVLDYTVLGRASRRTLFQQPRKADFQAAEQALEKLGIASLAAHPCDTLSGGEFRLVQIAKALTRKTRLLVLDEPESNLDFRNQLLVLETLKHLSEEGMAIVWNTHYPGHALRYAHRALLLQKGAAYVFGSAECVLTEAHLSQAFGVQTAIISAEREGRLLRDVIALGD